MRTGNIAELVVIEDGLAVFVAGHVYRVRNIQGGYVTANGEIRAGVVSLADWRGVQ